MDDSNIKVAYRDTPEKFRAAADEVLAFLVANLRALNAEQEKYTKMLDYAKRGIRMKGMPGTSEAIWAQYKTHYGELAAAFCSEELLARGYANHTADTWRVIEPDGTLKECGVFGDYSYLDSGCELAVTMKSNQRAVVEVLHKDKDSLTNWKQFALANTVDGWRLVEVKYKLCNSEKWKAGWI